MTFDNKIVVAGEKTIEAEGGHYLSLCLAGSSSPMPRNFPKYNSSTLFHLVMVLCYCR